jgi:2-amino-4-hydroxy-6-hydroxymethyldihydropteridine diphosphokinase
VRKNLPYFTAILKFAISILNIMPNPYSHTVTLALGSNLGDRLQYLASAREYLEKQSISTMRCSKIYETPPMGPPPQSPYLNQCIQMETVVPPEELLTYCKKVEQLLGRVHRQRWGSREIDIDILFYGKIELDLPHLSIPHPAWIDRQFVLVPLANLDPNAIFPKTTKTVKQLLNCLQSQNGVEQIQEYFSGLKTELTTT